MSAPPELTVCVPVYNAAAFVETTLESIRAQTYPNLQVLVSVDRSDDASLAVCSNFDLGRPARVIAQSERRHYVGNVNDLLRSVETELVCVMPHDDTIEPDYLAVLVDALMATPSAVVAYSDIVRVGPDHDRTNGVPMSQPAVTGARIDRMIEFLHARNSAVACRGVVRVDMLPDLALPDNPCRGFASDTAWLLHLACHGDLHRVARPLYRKCIRDTSVVRGWLREDREWHRRAWFEHCLSCARICLARELDDAETTVVRQALIRRLTMTHRNLWPASGIFDMSEVEKEQLAADLLRALAS